VNQIVCPHCEKPVEGHDDAGCRRRMTRRHFFGLGLGAVAAVQAMGAHAPKSIIREIAVFQPEGWEPHTVTIALTHELQFDQVHRIWRVSAHFYENHADGTRTEIETRDVTCVNPCEGARLIEARAFEQWLDLQEGLG
jgi:hypothetical protein